MELVLTIASMFPLIPRSSLHRIFCHIGAVLCNRPRLIMVRNLAKHVEQWGGGGVVELYHLLPQSHFPQRLFFSPEVRLVAKSVNCELL